MSVMSERTSVSPECGAGTLVPATGAVPAGTKVPAPQAQGCSPVQFLWSLQKQPVRLVAGFGQVRIAEAREEGMEVAEVTVRHFECGQHASKIGAVVAVVEQADVPATPKRFEELHQRAGALGKLEAAGPLVARIAGTAADHVAD